MFPLKTSFISESNRQVLALEKLWEKPYTLRHLYS